MCRTMLSRPQGVMQPLQPEQIVTRKRHQRRAQSIRDPSGYDYTCQSKPSLTLSSSPFLSPPSLFQDKFRHLEKNLPSEFASCLSMCHCISSPAFPCCLSLNPSNNVSLARECRRFWENVSSVGSAQLGWANAWNGHSQCLAFRHQSLD